MFLAGSMPSPQVCDPACQDFLAVLLPLVLILLLFPLSLFLRARLQLLNGEKEDGSSCLPGLEPQENPQWRKQKELCVGLLCVSPHALQLRGMGGRARSTITPGHRQGAGQLCVCGPVKWALVVPFLACFLNCPQFGLAFSSSCVPVSYLSPRKAAL